MDNLRRKKSVYSMSGMGRASPCFTPAVSAFPNEGWRRTTVRISERRCNHVAGRIVPRDPGRLGRFAARPRLPPVPPTLPGCALRCPDLVAWFQPPCSGSAPAPEPQNVRARQRRCDRPPTPPDEWLLVHADPAPVRALETTARGEF